MRKTILLCAISALAISASASARSPSEIRRDRIEVQEQREDLREAQRRGDRSDIREERRELREARQELREDRRDRRHAQYAPPYRNWRYSSVTPGHQLHRSFYGSRYYVAAPVEYRHQRVTRNQRWIRYGDDALLVNVRSGRVLQVQPNYYW